MQIKFEAILEKRRLRRTIDNVTAKLMALPEGEICFHKNGRSTRWRLLTEDPETKRHKYLNLSKSSVDLAGQLCLKKYLQYQLQMLYRKMDCIERLLTCYEEKDILPVEHDDFYQLLTPYLPKNADLEAWAQEPYARSRERPEFLKVPTRCGILVRSKSEAIIADALFVNGIPFRYEELSDISGVTLAPDFKILNPRNPSQVFIWEHYGRMDSEKYIRNNLFKIELYQNAGFIAGNNLILTFESEDKVLDSNFVDFLVSYYFL